MKLCKFVVLTAIVIERQKRIQNMPAQNTCVFLFKNMRANACTQNFEISPQIKETTAFKIVLNYCLNNREAKKSDHVILKQLSFIEHDNPKKELEQKFLKAIAEEIVKERYNALLKMHAGDNGYISDSLQAIPPQMLHVNNIVAHFTPFIDKKVPPLEKEHIIQKQLDSFTQSLQPINNDPTKPHLAIIGEHIKSKIQGTIEEYDQNLKPITNN